MSGIEFAYPRLLLILIVIPVFVALYVLHYRKSDPTLTLSTTAYFSTFKKTWRNYTPHILFSIKIILILLLILIIARPQSTDRWQDTTTEGIDIMLVLDISGSMLAQDLKPNRIEAAKNISTEFISGRRSDRIGLVIFSGESFTQCPITTDHATIINLLREVESGMVEDGTAIGMGIATAVNRLKDSDAESKVVILLTDGVNNMGEISPEMGAELASVFGIRIYTIGVGSYGMAPFPVQTPFGVEYRNIETEIDEEVLELIAKETGGKYYRATDNEALLKVYEEINNLEKSVVDVKEHMKKEEEYLPLVIAALVLMLGYFTMRYLLLNKTV